MIGWRIPLATICLLIGVSFSADPSMWWRAVGGIFLVFVPALVNDHVMHVLTGSTPLRRAVALNNSRPDYRCVHFPADLAPDDETKMHSDKESERHPDVG